MAHSGWRSSVLLVVQQQFLDVSRKVCDRAFSLGDSSVDAIGNAGCADAALDPSGEGLPYVAAMESAAGVVVGSLSSVEPRQPLTGLGWNIGDISTNRHAIGCRARLRLRM